MGSFLVVLVVFGGHFWSSWNSFWAPGAVLGRSWEVLEALEAVLGGLGQSSWSKEVLRSGLGRS